MGPGAPSSIPEPQHLSWSRDGKAAELWYAQKRVDLPILEAAIARKGVSNVKAVAMEDLVDAFQRGVGRFLEVVAADPDLERRVNRRVGAWLAYLPKATSAPPPDRG